MESRATSPPKHTEAPTELLSRQKVDRIETELRQTAEIKEQKYINWRDVIDREGELPLPDDALWPKFVRAWREWYRTSVKHHDAEKQAENRYYYDAGKNYVESLDFSITEIEHTGSITLAKPSHWRDKGDEPDYEDRLMSYEIA